MIRFLTDEEKARFFDALDRSLSVRVERTERREECVGSRRLLGREPLIYTIEVTLMPNDAAILVDGLKALKGMPW